ncbi:MAG: hypothetical protein OXC91_00885 [Rhodobacteraceae bacterium]|nr:hypothetical protein [Paracoccaceae bacterium]
MEALLQAAQVLGLDINTLIIVMAGGYIWAMRRDVDRLEVQIREHESQCEERQGKIWRTVARIDSNVAELRGVVSTKPCKD